MAAASPLPLPGAADILRRPSLYVGDLHPDTTERDLMEKFSSVGTLDSVRLCTDTVTKRSLCYAYVNFLCFSDALKAMTLLNHTPLREKPMRIMWCQRDPLVRKSGIGNLFIKNLAPSVTSAQLERIFSNYGTIVSCKVVEEDGKSKCFGFVQFDSEQSAMIAISCLHGTMLEGKKLYVSKFIKKQEREAPREDLKFTNLYVKNFDDNLTEDLLTEKFSKYGKVHNAIIMRDEKGKSRGFGFVNFYSHEDAKRAVEGLNGALIGSKQLVVVNSAKIMRHDDGVSKGFGFVSFSSPGDAKKAMDSLNGTTCNGMCLYVAFAWPKEERPRTALAPRKPQFPTSNQDFIMPTLHEFLYYVPPYSVSMSIPDFNPYQSTSTTYQTVGRQMGTFFPAGMYTFRGNNMIYDTEKQSQQLPTKHLICQYNKSTKPVPLNDSAAPAAKQVNQKNAKASRKLKSKTINGVTALVPPPESATTTKVLTPVSVLQLMMGLELGHAAEINATLLEVEKSVIQKMLNLPESVVANIGEAINMLKEEYSWSD
ncbi:PREDICTED: polyadenylate-binding protein 4-like [Ipomoea nil]|uniref:polyadenylate-binding protein 4-like n=1 Tax=Ipomoea nil TaxID=35883 RepID=UPI0009010986|nr:PREDICTED: polyadenylate-binding protein 4-like [Ipomoea nil]